MKGCVVMVCIAKNQETRKPSTCDTIASIFVANAAASGVQRGVLSLSGIPFKKIKNNKELTSDVYQRAINPVFEKMKLKEVGIELVDTQQVSEQEIAKCVKGGIPKFYEKIKPLKQFAEKMADGQARQAKEGSNAFFVPHAKKIFVNNAKMPWTAFHEMGHALNGKSKILKTMQKSGRMMPMLALIPLCVGIFKAKKEENEQPKNKFDKATTFIKNNCGKLAFLPFVPMLFEEGLASVRGTKAAKEFLSKGEFKTLCKGNAAAWLTYLGMATAISLSAVIGSKVRDFIGQKAKEKIDINIPVSSKLKSHQG